MRAEGKEKARGGISRVDRKKAGPRRGKRLLGARGGEAGPTEVDNRYRVSVKVRAGRGARLVVCDCARIWTCQRIYVSQPRMVQ